MDRWELLYSAGLLVILFMPIILALIGSGKRFKAAQDKARERRLAEARMNARLLRFNI
jgi:hypothetical protein